jgi:hypothetical protein
MNSRRLMSTSRASGPALMGTVEHSYGQRLGVENAGENVKSGTLAGLVRFDSRLSYVNVRLSAGSRAYAHRRGLPTQSR